MNSNLNLLTLKEVINGIKKKYFCTRELTESILKRIKNIESKLSAFTFIDYQAVPGIPFAVKDVLSTRDIPSSASSAILNNYIPVFDATVVEKVKDKNGVVVGKTNCDSFAFGASTENSGYGPTKNPWDLKRVPGGSSGGSAAAVAADECIFALGTDTGGSIRYPASFCSVTGLKPTYGACSRWGILAMASSFDCPGPIGKTVEDCEIIFDIIKGKDEKDASSVEYLKMKKSDKVLTIGLPKEYFSGAINKEVKDVILRAAGQLQENGYRIEEVSLPHTDLGIAVYYVLVPSEISSNMARYDGIRFGREREKFEDEVKRRIIIGTFTLSAGYFDQYYALAMKGRKIIRDDFLNAYSKVDLLLGPVSPEPPFLLGEKISDPLKMYLSDVLTVGANLAGIPGLALPCGFTKNGLPIGMQLLGPHFSEKTLFKVGKDYQKITDWHKRKPKL